MSDEAETRCPHCGGPLRDIRAKGLSWQYECLTCGRGWEVQGDKWVAQFDAGQNNYILDKDGFHRDVPGDYV